MNRRMHRNAEWCSTTLPVRCACVIRRMAPAVSWTSASAIVWGNAGDRDERVLVVVPTLYIPWR